MEQLQFAYKESVSHIDFKRNIDHIHHQEFKGLDDSPIKEFLKDIEENNDSIELHLARTKAYKEALILDFTKEHDPLWKRILKEEQKTFGGSKIFYLNESCSRILVLAVKGEVMNKLKLLVSRISKVNEKIKRYNASAKKENLEVYTNLVKNKSELTKEDEIVYYLNQNLKI